MIQIDNDQIANVQSRGEAKSETFGYFYRNLVDGPGNVNRWRRRDI